MGRSAKLASKSAPLNELIGEEPAAVRKSNNGNHKELSSAVKKPSNISNIASLASNCKEPVFIGIEETISALFDKDNGLERFEAKGSLSLHILDASFSNCSLQTKPKSLDGFVDIKCHPNIDKALFDEEGTLAMRDAGKQFPANQSLSLLKWRFNGSASQAAILPLLFNVWPSRDAENNLELVLEFSANKTPINDLLIKMPVDANPLSIDITDGVGLAEYDAVGHMLVWTIDCIATPNCKGFLNVRLAVANVEDILPIQISFNTSQSVCGMEVYTVVANDTQNDVPFECHTKCVTQEYSIE